MIILERVNIIMLLEKLDVMSVSHFFSHFLYVMYLLLFNHWLIDAILCLIYLVWWWTNMKNLIICTWLSPLSHAFRHVIHLSMHACIYMNGSLVQCMASLKMGTSMVVNLSCLVSYLNSSSSKQNKKYHLFILQGQTTKFLKSYNDMESYV